MRLARCHIQDLIVSAALLPVCRQHGTLFQAVGAAASYHQWFCVILEIKTKVVYVARVEIHLNTIFFLKDFAGIGMRSV